MCRKWQRLSTIEGFKHYQQPEGSNECFIACAAMIISCFSDEEITPEDLKDQFEIGDVTEPGSAPELIRAYYKKVCHQTLFPTEDCADELESISDDLRNSVRDILVIDERPIPSLDELINTIVSCNKCGNGLLFTPFLCCVGNICPDDGPIQDYEGGHWVIIAGAGIDTDGNGWIQVYDPELSKFEWVPYNDQQYLREDIDYELFWESSTYCDLGIDLTVWPYNLEMSLNLEMQ